MPEGVFTSVTRLSADWIKQNLDKRRFVLALRQRNVQKPLVISLIRRSLPLCFLIMACAGFIAAEYALHALSAAINSPAAPESADTQLETDSAPTTTADKNRLDLLIFSPRQYS